jgi:antitoxin FitA
MMPAALPPRAAVACHGETSAEIIDICTDLETSVSDLLVRGVDEAVVKALKERAGAHGRSAEAEHRAMLAAALRRPRKRSFAEVLAAMPEAGSDADFERVQSPSNHEPPRGFD